ncbi:hypothetical protein [Roseivivax sediminis]|uniref:Uncharacterized protein n=1 Tax=Roseivivax sediminis TaxID=936889 RepID=A0A1I1ZYT2_9RHOB|nr:hypothetical protein [Roseivivax sediminis]SFE36862.1 hypothetical protein SAMN04515678_10915 [Roseivivax sediminis]
MQDLDSDIGDVRYNPATASFEALVTVETDRGPVRIPSDFEAPLDTGFHEAVTGLRRAAIRSLEQPDSLRSQIVPEGVDPDIAQHAAHPIQKLFGQLFGNRAA